MLILNDYHWIRNNIILIIVNLKLAKKEKHPLFYRANGMMNIKIISFNITFSP